MSRSTLFRLAFAAVLCLTACDTPDTASSAPAPLDTTGWRLASGKVPTQAEFAALTATCREKGGELDPCLATLGLKHGK